MFYLNFKDMPNPKLEKKNFFQKNMIIAKDLFTSTLKEIKACLIGDENKSIKTTWSERDCFKKYVLPIIGTIDKTGIVGLISAFIYPICPRTMEEWKLDRK